MSETDEQDEYYFLELFTTFKEALHRAKSISAKYHGLARVKREDEKFKVLVPLWVKNDILHPPTPEAEEDGDYYADQEEQRHDPVDEELEREKEDLISEIYGEAEDWNRSSETGWFYNDDDEST
jgi:hypothetical protein